MSNRILTSSNVLGTIAFFAMITAPAAYEGEMYITSAALILIFAGSAYLSLKENGKKDRPHCQPKLGAYQGHNNIDASIIR